MSNAKEAVEVVVGAIAHLDLKADQKDVITKVNELIDKVNSIKVRDRGPKSERSMTDMDAWRIKFGDLKDEGHKPAAAKLGLSYGQVYSARGGYTFTHVKPDSFKAADIK